MEKPQFCQAPHPASTGAKEPEAPDHIIMATIVVCQSSERFAPLLCSTRKSDTVPCFPSFDFCVIIFGTLFPEEADSDGSVDSGIIFSAQAGAADPCRSAV